MLIPKIFRRTSGLLSLRSSATRLNAFRKYASYKGRCEPHMNELPIPCGSWDDWYSKRQSTFNKILVFGAIWWILSISAMFSTGSFEGNWSAPANPGPPSDMVEECDDEDEL